MRPTSPASLRRLAVCATSLVMAVVAAAPPAAAATVTTTTGTVCCTANSSGYEDYGAYYFKGMTLPSRPGEFVYFQYKRPAWAHWHTFGVGPASTAGFYVLNRSHPRAKINNQHRWRTLFSMGVKQGKWWVRAVFRAQDGYARSSTREVLYVLASE